MEQPAAARGKAEEPRLVIITGLSGSGKGTVLKCFEDLGYFAVDNLPVELIPKFAELTADAPNIHHAALVVDIREREGLKKFPKVFRDINRHLATTLIFLEADEPTLVRRFSETRRPHPLGGGRPVIRSIQQERELLKPIRMLSSHIINTSKFNVHELREYVAERFRGGRERKGVMVYVTSFGFRYGIPPDADLVFDVRFLPNPNYVPALKRHTGRNSRVGKFIRSFPQTEEFLKRITELLLYLLPHYVEEGKSYLTIAFGCTGGRHRSVMMAEQIRRTLAQAGYRVKGSHRDIDK